MAASWTTAPRTWVDGETPTGPQFNVEIRDRFDYLKANPTIDGNLTVAGQVTTATLSVSGNSTLNTLGVQGVTNFNSGVNVAGALNAGGDLVVTGNLGAYGGNIVLGDAITDGVTINGRILNAPFRNYDEEYAATSIVGGVLTVNVSAACYFDLILNANCSVALTNPPPNYRTRSISIVFWGDGTQRTVTWPASVVWPGGTAPVLSSGVNKRDIITLITYSGGAVWFGMVCGQNY